MHTVSFDVKQDTIICIASVTDVLVCTLHCTHTVCCSYAVCQFSPNHKLSINSRVRVMTPGHAISQSCADSHEENGLILKMKVEFINFKGISGFVCFCIPVKTF